jgi:hypothetical protein
VCLGHKHTYYFLWHLCFVLTVSTNTLWRRSGCVSICDFLQLWQITSYIQWSHYVLNQPCIEERTNAVLILHPYDCELTISEVVWTHVKYCIGRAIAQAVSRRPPTSEARVRCRVSPCGICGGQSGNGTGIPPSTSGFPCQFYSTGAPLRGKIKKLITFLFIFITGLHNKP